MQRRWRRALLVSVLALLTVCVSPSSAFVVNGALGGTNGRIYYTVLPEFSDRYGKGNLWRGEQAWKIHGLATVAEYWNDDQFLTTNDNLVQAYNIDGRDGTIAHVTAGTTCASSWSGCRMAFDTSETWNVSDRGTYSNEYDLWGTAAHEFGHWHGLEHSPHNPSTHPDTPTMRSGTQKGYDFKRSLTGDDVNGFLTARQAGSILANRNFEDTFAGGSLDWSHRLGSNGGAWARYCNDWAGAADGACFVQFTGQNASMYQDLAEYSFKSSFYPSVWVRNRTGVPGSVTIALWFLGTGGNRSATCSLPAGMTWINCTIPQFTQTTNQYLRFEVYNGTSGGGGIDIDAAGLF